MSINCSNFCLYQVDGTCNLSSKEKKHKSKGNYEQMDCPYFERNDKVF